MKIIRLSFEQITNVWQNHFGQIEDPIESHSAEAGRINPQSDEDVFSTCKQGYDVLAWE